MPPKGGGVTFSNVSYHAKVKAHKSQRLTRPELISGFRSMKQAKEYCYSPPGRDASPLQGYPTAVCRLYPFIRLGEERQSGVKFLV